MPATKAAMLLLIDEDALFRRAMLALLEDAGFEVVAAGDPDEALQSAESSPELAILGLRSADGTSVDAVMRLCKATPTTKVLVLDGSTEPTAAVDVLRAGACGYVLKETVPAEIVAAVHAALSGGAPLSPAVGGILVEELRRLAAADGSEPDSLALTPRERHVLERLIAGSRNAEIAEELAISAYTVKRHVSNLFVKLGVENRTQAAVEATRRGLL